MTNQKLGAGRQPPVAMGGIAKEGLPLPYVHYPGHYGTFFAFSRERNSTPYLCECARPAVANFLRLRRKTGPDGNCPAPDQRVRLEGFCLPHSLVDLIGSQRENLEGLNFKTAVCHRCNLVPPTRRYCHEMYGTMFIQHFGWYVNQTYLRFGIVPRGISCLEDVTPADFLDDIQVIVRARRVQTEAMQWFRDRDEYSLERMSDPSLPPLAFDAEVMAERQATLREASKQLRRAERVLSTKIENTVREEFGFRKIGDRWTSETLLYTIVHNIFPNIELVRHYRPDWLQGLEVDIFLPSLGIAIEYQGQQHFHAIDAWGGTEALRALQERDRRKALLCKEQGVRLITFDYTEPLIQEYVHTRIRAR